jgi:hypothetical protein
MALTVRHLRWLGIPVTQRAEAEAFFREVDDARAAREELAGAGVEVGPLEADSSWEWFDVTGPEGLALEVGSRR